MNLTIENSVHCYNTDGEKGDDGADGCAGGGCGTHGQNGAAAQSGKDGRTLNVTLSVIRNHVRVQANNCIDTFPLNDRAISIAMQSRGGNGGNGGKGFAGSVGTDGVDAFEKNNGGNGGADGGNGGAGGNGGNGGKVIVNVHPDNADLLMLTSKPDTRGGKKGIGGRGASGGIGGKVGAGAECAVRTSYSDTDEKTKRPGGFDGYAVLNGKSGDDGADGVDGLPGSFTICMGKKTYTHPYDLKLTSCFLTVPNKNGIFEPGQLVSAHITLHNSGGMELPRTRVTLVDNNCLCFDPNTTIFLRRTPGAGRSHKPAKPLQFRINDFPTAIDESLNVETHVRFRATVDRVERHFKQVEDQVSPFVVQYPAQMEKVTGVTSISIDEEALISVRLNNVSDGHLGPVSKARRIVTLKYRVLPNGETTASDICFFSKEGDQCPGARGLTKSVDHLPPHSSTTFSGSLKFANLNLCPYTRVKIGVFLELGALTAPGNKQRVKTVQRRDFEVQLSDPYRYNPQADFLLVTNANTQRKEIEAWRSMAAMLGLNFSTWNCSMYNGISFYHKQPVPENSGEDSVAGPDEPRVGKHTTRQCMLAEHFANKTAVFLNYPAPDEKTSTDTLPSYELFQCAQAPYNLKFYTVGKAVSDTVMLSPDQLAVENVRTIPLMEKYFLFKNVSKHRLGRMVQKRARRFDRERPDIQKTVVFRYENKKLPGRGLCKKRHLGDAIICVAPTENMFIHRPMDPGKENQINTVFSQANIFGLLKSLPTAKKLELVNAKSEDYNLMLRATLNKVILSDLADEHSVFSQDHQAEPMGKKQLKKHLTTLRQVVSADYESHHAREFILETLREFRAFASRMPGKWDLLLNRRRRNLFSVTKQMIDKCASRYPENLRHWKSGYRAQKEFFKSIPREELWQRYNQEGIIRPELCTLLGCNQVFEVDNNFLQRLNDNPHPNTVVEQGHIYKSQKARREALERLETTGKALPEPEPLPGASGSV